MNRIMNGGKSTRKPGFVLSLSALVLWSLSSHSILGHAQGMQKSPNWRPSSGSIVEDITGKWTKNGGVIFFGKAKLPKGTVIWFQVDSGKEHKLSVGDGERFETPPLFQDSGELFSEGSHSAAVTAHFNGAWQSPHILALVGDEGKNLPALALVPEDKEFPNAGGHLSVTTNVVLPTMPTIAKNSQAIRAVQAAKLNVQGRGPSSESVAGSLKYFVHAGGFQPMGWMAELVSRGKWKVTLKYKDGTTTKNDATWEYDEVTRQVNYTSRSAKTLSYVPAE